MERNGPNCKPGQTTPKRELTRFWARGPKSHFRRGVIHLQPPTLGGCHPSELPHRTPNQPKLIRVLLVAARADRLLTYKPKNGPYRARGLKSQMSRGVIHLQPPTLGGFHPSELPHRTPNHPKRVRSTTQHARSTGLNYFWWQLGHTGCQPVNQRMIDTPIVDMTHLRLKKQLKIHSINVIIIFKGQLHLAKT